MEVTLPDRGGTETLAPGPAAALVEFARACRAAIHAVSLYPPEHPAIGRAVARITEVSERTTTEGPFRIAVLPSDLVIDGRHLARPEASVADLAALLHGHLVGQLTITSGMDDPGWRRFLGLVTRAPEDLHEEGGIAGAWRTAGGQHIEIREIDYGQVLREGADGEQASWDLIISHCLSSDAIDLDERAIQALVAILDDPTRLSEFAFQLENRVGTGSGVRTQTAALLQILGAVVEAIGAGDGERLDPIFRNLAGVAGSFSPETMLQWLAASAGGGGKGAGVPGAAEVVARLDDTNIAQFVAGSIVVSRGATARLAEAFHALVPDPNRQRRLLGLAEQKVASSPLGREEGFELLWKHAERLLASYSDEPFVPEDYAQELNVGPTRAKEVEQMSDDPPERLAAWLGSISDQALRHLDVQLLLDLLALEGDPVRWIDLARVVATQVNDLVLVGDFEGAARLVEGLTAGGPDRRDRPAFQQAVTTTIERLLAGQIVLHLVYHLQVIDDDEFEQAKRISKALGAQVIKPLAEALAAEERARVRLRLTEMLLAFGALDWPSIEQLKQSANPSVRRTAVFLLREFGGSAALPGLESLLDDAEPHVQREAVRAIVVVGTDEAYDVLQRALTSGTDRSRDAILQHLQGAQDDRLVPLFCYILRHTDHRGRLQGVYLKAIAALGILGGPEAVDALGEALARGEWWAPRRNRILRGAAAQALRRTGDEGALRVLEDAVARGTSGARAAARAALADARPAPPRSGRS